MASLDDERYRLEQESAARVERNACGDAKGSKAGYLRHMRAKPKERACAECRNAWRKYYREYNRENMPTIKRRIKRRKDI